MNESKKELEWQEPIKIEEGKHTGTIRRGEYRTKPYEYTDVFIGIDDTQFELKYGCPTAISQNSKLGKLLITLGAEYKPKGKIVPEEFLVGKRVEFMTMNKKSKKDNKEYAEIVEDSIKLLDEEKLKA